MSRPARIEIADFGPCGDTLLLAEYDAEVDTIRVNGRALERVRAERGALEAELFMASAVAHEAFHRAQPNASEAAVHAHVRAATGSDPRRFETFVRVRCDRRDVEP